MLAVNIAAKNVATSGNIEIAHKSRCGATVAALLRHLRALEIIIHIIVESCR